MAEEADGQLRLAKAARSPQDKELEAREAAVRKPAVLSQPQVHERETLECYQVFSQHVLHRGLFSFLGFSPLPRHRELYVSDALLRLTPGPEQFMNGRPGRQFAQTPPSHEPRVFTKSLHIRPVRCSKQLTRLANSAISVTSTGQSRLATAL